MKFLLFMGFVIVASTAVADAAKDQAAWQGKMSELSAALTDMIPDLFANSETETPAQIAGLNKKVEKLDAIVKNLDPSLGHAVKAPDRDPALPFLAQQLRENIESANQSLKEGHTEYAKTVLRSSVSYCIACHTRSQTGPQFPIISAFSETLKNASWIDRITFQAASRQFDPANQSVIDQLKTGLHKEVKSFDLQKAARIALAIGIRVKKNPEQGLVLAKAIIDSKQASAPLKDDARVWLKDLQAWQSEGQQKLKSDKDLIVAARKLIGVSEATDAPVWTPHSEVKYLRASVLMHDLLRQYPDSPLVAEALYLTGLSYDQLRDLGLYSLHEMYFRACIAKAPHSELAEKCFGRYRESITFGYTGSQGTMIPAGVEASLKALKENAYRIVK
jgi:hypothetical protein